jgi:hypothetical protein
MGFLLPDFVYPVYALTGLTKSGSKKAIGPEQDRQSLGARRPKGLNRIYKIWEQERHRAKQDIQNIFCLGPLVFLLPDFVYSV